MDSGPAWAPDVGDSITGPQNSYVLLEHIDTGGFTKVFKAKVKGSGEIVGVKYPNFDSPNPDFEAYVEREIRALRTIRCLGDYDNVMTLREHFVEQGTDFIVVDFIDGKVLGHSPVERDPERVRRIGLKICMAFLPFHWNDLVYRDVKADNIMLTQDDEPILIDLNTVRSRPSCMSCKSDIPHEYAGDTECHSCGDSLGPVTMIFNTGRGHYRAPEQADSSVAPGPWTDVYGIGKLLFLLLTGFVTQSDGVDIRNHRTSPEYLADIIQKATARNPTRRFASVEELGRALSERTDNPGAPMIMIRDEYYDEEFGIRSGDSIGRSGGGKSPRIDTKDYRRLVSREHAVVEYRDQRWVIADKSLNGTFLHRGERCYGLLSEKGKQVQPDAVEQLPGHRAISIGDHITPVHPEHEKKYLVVGPEWTNV